MDLGCLCHVAGDASDSTETILKFTETNWEKVWTCAQQWKDVDGVEQQVSRNLLEQFRSDIRPEDGLGYHPKCYRK